MPRLSFVLIATAVTLVLIRPCIAETPSLVDDGRNLYRTATRADGSAIAALVQSDVPLPPAAAACVNCHRRSGYGVSEGGSRSLNLTAPALFQATTKPPIRPAYDDPTLVRAIVAGIAADGRELHATMPRYNLNERDAAALTAYLRTLGASSPPGVSGTELTIATVIARQAPVAEQNAVTSILKRFLDVKNAGTRSETKRAAASDRHYYGRTWQRAFRTWKLQVWTLEGPASTWQEQLQSYYAAQPPFAIVSGTAGPDWSQVHDFCEANAVPCILPLASSPDIDESGFYSLYFSAGATLQARVAAQHITQTGVSSEAKILVIHGDNDASRDAFDEFREQLAEREFNNTHSVQVSKRRMSTRKWRKLLRSEQPDVLVAWLPAKSVSTLGGRSIDASLVPSRIYTANAFSDWLSGEAEAGALAGQIQHVYPYTLPRKGLTQFPREQVWLRQQGFGDLDAIAAAKALYACRVLGMGLADIQSNFSREYLLESLEHALDGTQLTSLFPRTILGPDQRLLSRGAYVVDLTKLEEGEFANAVWIQP